jgi:hypothetical protein
MGGAYVRHDEEYKFIQNFSWVGRKKKKLLGIFRRRLKYEY